MRGKRLDDIAQSIDAHVGKRIKDRRHQMKMSQGTLGELIGVTFQSVQKYEDGKHSIAVPRLVWISKALKKPIPFFFKGLDAGAEP